MEERKKVTVLTLRKMKQEGKKVVYLTSYDYPFAYLADQAGVDIILVGDSLGMTVYGYKSTLPVTIDDMVKHTSAVCRAVKYAFVIGDMPFMSYQPSDRDAIINAGRLIAETGCDAVKCEGGKRIASRIKAITDSGILVQGHIGLTPQSLGPLGGFKVQGKTKESIDKLIEDAVVLEESGVFSIVLEAMLPETAAEIGKHVKIPLYGIGAGDRVDGQVAVIHDILGLFQGFKPKFVKRYLEGGTLIKNAISSYCSEVRKGEFPKPEHFYNVNKKTSLPKE